MNNDKTPSEKLKDTGKKIRDFDLNARREAVPRKPDGRFGKGNKNAIGRMTQHKKKTQVFRDIVSATPAETFAKIWARVLSLATGDLDNNVNPEIWAVKLVVENLIGNRLVIEQAEEIEELRYIVEQWVQEHHGDNGKVVDPAVGILENAEDRGIIDVVDSAPQ